MPQRENSSCNVICILLVAVVLMMSFASFSHDRSEVYAPLFSEHTHTSSVAHSHLEHQDGTFEHTNLFVTNRQEAARPLADGYAFGIRSRHGLPLERPPESAPPFS
jgi:hypothetical protein